MNKIVLVFCLILISAALFGQAAEAPIMYNAKNNIGLGAGLDYGGFGIRYTYMPAPKVGVFGSLGYILVGPGYNFGANYKFSPDRRVTPYLTGMYGYNAAIKIVGASQWDKIYYGPSFGFGVEVKRRNKTKNFWNFALLVPVRSAEYKSDMDVLLNNPDIEISELLPITFSIGFHFGLD